MTGVEKKNEHNELILCIKTLFFIFIIVSMLIMAYYIANDKLKVGWEDRFDYIEEWKVVDSEGNEFTTGRYFRDNRAYKEDFSIYATLPDDIKDGDVLFFYASRDTAVFVNDDLRASFDTERDVVIPGGVVKRFYMMAPLYASDAGGEVRMVRFSTARRPEIVPETVITTKYGVYSYLMKEFGLTFWLSNVLLIFSSVVILVGIGMFIWYRQHIEMLSAALGIFVCASWLTTNSYLYPFIFNHYHIDGIVNYMLCLMMPFGFLFYLDSIRHGRDKRFMIFLMLLSSANAIIFTLLHFLEVVSYSKALFVIDTVLGLIIVGVIYVLVKDLKEGYTKEYKYMAVGFFGFIICALAEIVAIVFLESKNDSIPMLIGLSILLIFVVIQQVDDLKKIGREKQEAIKLSDAKTKFLTSMSHEIRTPINSILGMNEMILRENKDEAISEYARTIKSSGNMLLMLINDVLDFSKIEAGKMEINEGEYRLSNLINEILPMVSERASFKGLTYKSVLVNEVPNGQYSDEFRIKQILINLINNAIKYTDEGGVTLLIGGRYKDEYVFDLDLTVKDTGRGIKKEDIDGLFSAFTRAETNKNGNIEGTGLGLAIVKSIVDSLNGQIRVMSEYMQGSEFIVTIPVKVTDKTPVGEDLDYIAEDNPEDQISECDYYAPDAKVLAVDDNKANLKIVKLFLKRTGIKPDTCESGAEAIDMCKKKKYDLILLDHMMPAPDGIETLKRIRNSKESLNKHTVALVLTANALSGSRSTYMEAGFADYLTKPLDSHLLEERVKKYLPDYKVLRHEAVSEKEPEENESALIKRLKKIDGMDYTAALRYSGDDEEILEELINDIVEESNERIERLKVSLEKEDLDAYGLEAHATKGLLATAGFVTLSKRAEKHEKAAKDGNLNYIKNDAGDFFASYLDICERLKTDG